MNPSVDQSEQLSLPLSWNPGFLLILLACILGGFFGGAIVHQVHPLFAYTDLPEIDLGASAKLVQQHRDAAFEYRSWNYGADLAIIGLAFGMTFGAFTGGSRRLLSIIAGGLAGSLMGAGVGYLGGLYVAKTILLNAEQTLQASMGLQAIVWGLILSSIVCAVAAANIGTLSAGKYCYAGLVAGFSVAVTQFVVSSCKFPASNPLFLVPEQSTERIYWLAAFPIVSGLVLAFVLRRR